MYLFKDEVFSYNLSWIKSFSNYNKEIFRVNRFRNKIECSNCSYRYVDRNVTAIKARLIKAFLIVSLPIILISIIFFTGVFSNNSKPDLSTKKIEVKALKQEIVKKPEIINDTIVKKILMLR